MLLARLRPAATAAACATARMLGLCVALFPHASHAQPLTASAPLRGTDVPSGSPAVALCEGTTSLDCALRCSGVLIAPRLVLTARHCSETVRRDRVRCMQDTYSDTLSAASKVWVTGASRAVPSSPWVRGRTWVVPRSVSACGDDLALLELEATPTWPSQELEPSFEGVLDTRLRYAVEGFGPTDEASNDSGRRRRASAQVICNDEKDTCSSVADGDSLMPEESVSDAFVCPGDSGGPLLDLDNKRVFGVLSRAFESTNRCGLGVYQRLGRHRRLLAQVAVQAAEHATLSAPAWARAALNQSNAPPLAVGAPGTPCDAAADCPGSACVSFDSSLTWQCASACVAGSCAAGQYCRDANDGAFCKPTPTDVPPASKCSATPAVTASGQAAAGFFLVVFLVAARLQARRGARPSTH